MSILMNKMLKIIVPIVLLCLLTSLVLVSTNVFANGRENEKLSTSSESKASLSDNTEDDSVINGPSILMLIDKAQLILPENTRFLPSEFLGGKKRPGKNSKTYLGMIEPKSNKQIWFINVNYIPSGHIETSKNIKLDVNKLFNDMKNQNDLDNNGRAKKDGRLMEFVGGWLIEPKFDYGSHELRYAYLKKHVGSVTTAKYVSVFLGREGYFSLDLYTRDSEFSEDKKYADNIISTVQFIKGNAYNDYFTGEHVVASYGIDKLVSEVEPEVYGPPDLHTKLIRLFWIFIYTLPITVIFIYVGFIKDRLKSLKSGERDFNKISLFARIKEIILVINRARNKYFTIWLSLVLLVFAINLMAVSFKINQYIYYFLIVILYFPYFIALVRLTAYGKYDHCFNILPSFNLRTLRVFGWSLAIVFIELVPVICGVISYKLGANNLVISPLVALVLSTCFGLVALYICIRLIFAYVAACYDIPSPIKASWVATKGKAFKVFLTLSIFGFVIGFISTQIAAGNPLDLFNKLIFNNPASYLKPLLTIAYCVTLQIIIYVIYAIFGLLIFGVRNEQNTDNCIKLF